MEGEEEKEAKSKHKFCMDLYPRLPAFRNPCKIWLGGADMQKKIFHPNKILAKIILPKKACKLQQL